MTISWNPATDPNNDELTYYVKLVDYSSKSVVYTDFTQEPKTSVSFNTLLVSNGDYDILVEACDASACTPFYWLANQGQDDLGQNQKITINNTETEHTWAGGTSTDWTQSANWSGSSIPTDKSSNYSR